MLFHFTGNIFHTSGRCGVRHGNYELYEILFSQDIVAQDHEERVFQY